MVNRKWENREEEKAQNTRDPISKYFLDDNVRKTLNENKLDENLKTENVSLGFGLHLINSIIQFGWPKAQRVLNLSWPS